MSNQKQMKLVEKLSKDMTIDKESRDALKWILKEVEEEEEEEKCSGCSTTEDIHQCNNCDIVLCIDCDENEMATFDDGLTYCNGCFDEMDEYGVCDECERILFPKIDIFCWEKEEEQKTLCSDCYFDTDLKYFKYDDNKENKSF